MLKNNDAWFIHGPFDPKNNLVDDELFRTCRVYSDATPLHYHIDEGGEPTSFTYASFHIPVVDERLHDVFLRHDPKEIQLIPVVIGEIKKRRYWILNVLKKVQCLDEKNSTIMWWNPEDDRPDKVGQYRMVSKMVLDRQRIGDARIFRLDGWEVALIVDGEFRRELEQAGISGVRFQKLN